MHQSFTGRHALVVGGTSGMGGLLSAALAREGASVIAVGRSDSPFPGNITGIQVERMDLESQDGRERTLALARDADILCVVWGPFEQKGLDETGTDSWDRLVSANLAFPGSLVSAALPRMRASHWGRILLFGGTRTDEVRGFLTNAAYGAAKTGLSSLAKSVSLAYAGEGISCNVVCPGFVDSETLNEESRLILAAKSPDGVLISPDLLVEAGIFLLKGALMNGISLRLDKGWEPKFI